MTVTRLKSDCHDYADGSSLTTLMGLCLFDRAISIIPSLCASAVLVLNASGGWRNVPFRWSSRDTLFFPSPFWSMMMERQSSYMNSSTLEKCRQSLGLACGRAVPKLTPF